MSAEASDNIVVLVTCPPASATDLARPLVKEKLAACVNVMPSVRSIYAWEGEICDDPEALLVIKTRRDLFDRLCQRVVELHPYDVPEVIALPLAAGHGPYVEWLQSVTGD